MSGGKGVRRGLCEEAVVQRAHHRQQLPAVTPRQEADSEFQDLAVVVAEEGIAQRASAAVAVRVA